MPGFEIQAVSFDDIEISARNGGAIDLDYCVGLMEIFGSATSSTAIPPRLLCRKNFIALICAQTSVCVEAENGTLGICVAEMLTSLCNSVSIGKLEAIIAILVKSSSY